MKTLAMLKMEKNFVAHIEKKYPRNPYDVYTTRDLLSRLNDETHELIESVVMTKDVESAKQECADISNIIDYIFERLANGRIE